MPTVKYEVNAEDVKPTVGGPLPKPGWYNARIASVGYREDKGDYLFQIVLTDGNHKGFRLWDYINFSNSNLNWRIAQLLNAVGRIGVDGNKKKTFKGSFDPASTEGTSLTVYVSQTSYMGELQGKLKAYAPLESAGDTDVEEADEDELDTEVGEEDDEETDEDAPVF